MADKRDSHDGWAKWRDKREGENVHVPGTRIPRSEIGRSGMRDPSCFVLARYIGRLALDLHNQILI